MASMTCRHSIRKMMWLARDVGLKLCMVSHLGQSSDGALQQSEKQLTTALSSMKGVIICVNKLISKAALLNVIWKRRAYPHFGAPSKVSTSSQAASNGAHVGTR